MKQGKTTQIILSLPQAKSMHTDSYDGSATMK